jgi:hypothetical protein
VAMVRVGNGILTSPRELGQSPVNE